MTSFGSRGDFGFMHGPWLRSGGLPRLGRVGHLPLRPRYTARTRREAVLAFVRLMAEDGLARAMVNA